MGVEMEDGKMEFCPLMFFFTDIYYIAVMFLIPLNETIISPIFHRCIPRITRYGKTTVGMILQFGRYITLITLIVVTRHDNYTNMPHTNITLCIFQENPNILNHTTSLGIISYKLYSIPEFISAISYIMILVGAIEFLCSQIPYSMKGLIVGIFYGSVVLASVLNRTISQIFTLKISLWEAKTICSVVNFGTC